MTHTHPLSAHSHTDWLTLLDNMATVADEIGLHYFEKAKNMTLSVEDKDNKTPVSEGDLAIEKEIRRILGTDYPGLAVLGEEFGACAEDEEYKLIIDPIDGTSNFIRGIPFYSALLGLEKKGEIVAGVVSCGATRDRWSAARGHGSTHNGRPISVTTVDDISQAQAFHGGLFGNEARGDRERLLNLMSKTKRQRGIGDYLMHTLVASGCGEFAIDFGLAPWDLAPLGIVVEEAGGTVTQVDGSPFSHYNGSILTSNGQFHSEIVAVYRA